MTIHQSLPFINWVQGVLEAGSLTVGVMKRPEGVVDTKGYVVVYPIAGGLTEGSIDNPRSDAAPNVQVTSFSRDEEQALWLDDKVRTLINAAVPAALPGGRRAIWLDFEPSSPSAVRDDNVEPSLFMAVTVLEVGTV